MFKITFILCLTVLVFTTNSFSQNNNNSILLYSQKSSTRVSGIASSTYYPSAINYECWVADDFNVSEHWSIDQIIVSGDTYVSADGFNIYIYTNKNNKPDSIVYFAANQPYSLEDDLFTISLANPIELKAGNYWISVRAVLNWDYKDNAYNAWTWNRVIEAYKTEAVYKRPAYGGCRSWSSIHNCWDTVGTDMYFELYGQSKITSDSLLYSQTDLYYIYSPSYKNSILEPKYLWEQIADDFTITSNWMIDKIIVAADYTPSSYLGGFNIYIYTNKNGFPDSLVYFAETQSYLGLYSTYLVEKDAILLVTPANLNAGDYFISVQYQYYQVDSTNTGWYWTQVEGSYREAAKYRNSSDTTWNTLQSGGEMNMYFELYGTSPALTDVAEGKVKLPSKYYLEQNYPNPFNPSTKISWQSPVAGHQTLKVYDVLGNEVATLIDEYRPAGNYEVTFDASKLSSGIYFYKLQAGNFVETKKMTLVR